MTIYLLKSALMQPTTSCLKSIGFGRWCTYNRADGVLDRTGGLGDLAVDDANVPFSHPSG